jgi:hypothetical protein
MLTAILAMLFWIDLRAVVSTYVSQGKRWWDSRGYRVRIVRRYAWGGCGPCSSCFWLSV